MNKKIILTNLLAMLLTPVFMEAMNCCYIMGQLPSDTATVVGRLQYVYALKDVVNERVWQGFTDKKNDVPLIYYDDTCCYVVNPSDKILALYKTNPVYQNDEINIFQMQRIDNVPFHMHVTFTDRKTKSTIRLQS